MDEYRQGVDRNFFGLKCSQPFENMICELLPVVVVIYAGGGEEVFDRTG
jgi:hypothetical protein